VNKLYCPTCSQYVKHSDPDSYGGKLKAWRIGRKMSQKMLAMLVGVHEDRIRRWENAGSIPSRPIRILLAHEGFNSNYTEGK